MSPLRGGNDIMFLILGTPASAGVANLVGLATETAEISEFFLNGLSELCG